MSDQYHIPTNIAQEKNKMNFTNEQHKRKRFDSVSTNSSCGDNNNNQQQQQQQQDARFEPRQIPDVQKVKKSFLSSQYTNNNNNNMNTKSSISMGLSSMSSTGKRGSYLSATTMAYQIILAIRLNSENPNEDSVYHCFPEVEMVLDDDLTVESVTREIIEKLNMKMTKELRIREKYFQSKLKSCELLHSVNGSEDCFEIAQCSKNGEPKGCSFDRNQILRNIKCKSRLCLKVLDVDAFNPIVFKLLNKQPTPAKKYDFDVSPIQEQEDDLSHYKDSLIQKDIEHAAFNSINKFSSSQQPTQSNQSSTIHLKEEVIQTAKQQCVPKKKISFWSRLFKCSVLCP